ncbi:hypothetical protein PI124_g10336 [Phytophthora idaei]|nr:hypothetical protein PI125_g9883 [Phytophthora idaei]KAG3164730.1 hypothetical protein PI126_g4954 [Phytophthora idaei]KAG3244905.1 hypothetical protein PI124_g10336 [Phytophthora idaei]
MRYPVNGKGIVSLLKAVGLLGDALEHPESVGLIFIGANDSGPSITSKQPIPWKPIACSDPVSLVPNIGDAKTEALVKIGIKTVGQLDKAIRGSNRHVFKNGILAQYALDFKSLVQRLKLTKKMLSSIPQYLWKA